MTEEFDFWDFREIMVELIEKADLADKFVPGGGSCLSLEFREKHYKIIVAVDRRQLTDNGDQEAQQS